MKTIYQALAEIEQKNRAAAYCVIVRSQGSTPRHTTSKMVVYPDGQIIGSVGGGEMERRVIEEAHKAIKDGRSRMLEYNMNDPQRGDPGICGGQLEIFVEPINPRPTIVVIGLGHVGKAVVSLAHWLGFYVVASDDREEFCNPQATPEADEYLACKMGEIPNRMEINNWSYLVLTTRGADVDIEGLPELLNKPAAFLGIIGSRRRWLHTRQMLTENGVQKELLEKVTSPVGLELNAETPQEIAVSILSEIIMRRNGGHGKPMEQLNGTEK